MGYNEILKSGLENNKAFFDQHDLVEVSFNNSFVRFIVDFEDHREEYTSTGTAHGGFTETIAECDGEFEISSISYMNEDDDIIEMTISEDCETLLVNFLITKIG